MTNKNTFLFGSMLTSCEKPFSFHKKIYKKIEQKKSIGMCNKKDINVK